MMNICKSILLIVLFLASCDYKNVSYYKANQLKEIDDILGNQLHCYEAMDILVIFDFNYTLMYPLEPCLHIKNIEKHKASFKKIANQVSRAEMDQILGHLMATNNQELISNHLSKFLTKYIDVNFIVCSSSLSANIDAYINLLKKNNIAISNTYNLPDFKFTEYDDYLSDLPIYKDSIILTNRVDKGLVLKSFIQKLQKKPKLIIFIDNNSEKLHAVKEALSNELNSKLIIIEYLEYSKHNVKSVSEGDFYNYWSLKLKSFKDNTLMHL